METDRNKIAKAADEALEKLAEYAANYVPKNEETFETAAACLADTLGCGILALNYPACTKLLGPIVPGITVEKGARVPGTRYVLDPVTAAFNIGTIIRWLDFNDAFLAAEWGHPSDNLGGILAVADYLDQNGTPMSVQDILIGMIKAHEIQGGLSLENSFNRVGFDHVILVKAASAAVAAKMLGGTQSQIRDTLANVFIDVGPLRTYRHAPNTGSRKSWAAGDCTSRGVQLAYLTMRGEMGYPQALSAKKWGLYDVLFDGKPFTFQRPLSTYVMDHVLFKISYPAEFHAQTAVECACQLHHSLIGRLDEIVQITITTHESAVRIIDKTGPLYNPADRDHCIQYMVAIGLIFGDLNANHYEDAIAKDQRIDALRKKMVVIENPQYSKDYLDPNKRSISNALTVELQDGSKIGPVEVQYPIGHKRRRKEGLPLLKQKFKKNLGSFFDSDRVERIVKPFEDTASLMQMPVKQLMELFL